eukprot:4674766-Karenia_brevis.AAC.1
MGAVREAVLLQPGTGQLMRSLREHGAVCAVAGWVLAAPAGDWEVVACMMVSWFGVVGDATRRRDVGRASGCGTGGGCTGDGVMRDGGG